MCLNAYRSKKTLCWVTNGSCRAINAVDIDVKLTPPTHKGGFWKDGGRGSRVLEYFWISTKYTYAWWVTSIRVEEVGGAMGCHLNPRTGEAPNDPQVSTRKPGGPTEEQRLGLGGVWPAVGAGECKGHQVRRTQEPGWSGTYTFWIRTHQSSSGQGPQWGETDGFRVNVELDKKQCKEKEQTKVCKGTESENLRKQAAIFFF